MDESGHMGFAMHTLSRSLQNVVSIVAKNANKCVKGENVLTIGLGLILASAYRLCAWLPWH